MVVWQRDSVGYKATSFAAAPACPPSSLCLLVLGGVAWDYHASTVKAICMVLAYQSVWMSSAGADSDDGVLMAALSPIPLLFVFASFKLSRVLVP